MASRSFLQILRDEIGLENLASEYQASLDLRSRRGTQAVKRGAKEAVQPFIDVAESGRRLVSGAPQTPLPRAPPLSPDSLLAGAPRVITGALEAASAPVMALGDVFLGRPVESATGIPRDVVTDVASIALPLGQVALAERGLARAAKAADMIPYALQQSQAALAKGRAALAADTAARAAQAKKLAKMQKPPGMVARVVDPFTAAVSKKAAQNQATRAVVSGAEDPAAVSAALNRGDVTLVPGSAPTTFEQTGDAGLAALQQGVTARSPAAQAAFDARAAEQSAARTTALEDMQSGGDPLAVSQRAVAAFNRVDDTTSADIAAARAEAETAASQIGGTAAPEAVGTQIRDRLAAAEDVAKAQVKTLRDAIDPTNSIQVDTAPIRVAAEGLVKELVAAPLGQKLSATEETLVGELGALEGDTSLNNVLALNSRIAEDMRAELRVNGRTTAWRRMAILKKSIDDAFANAVGAKVAEDTQAVDAGDLPPDAHVSARLEQWVRDFRTGKSDTEGTTRMAPEDRERIAAFTEATVSQRNTFGIGPVGDILRRGESASTFKMRENASVAQTAWQSGTTGYEKVNAVLAADPGVMPFIEDAAALSLRRAADPGNTGTLDPGALARWRASHADALRALPPERQALFNDAATAGEAVAQAATARTTAMRNFRSDAAWRFLYPQGDAVAPLAAAEDVSKAMGSVLTGPKAATNMQSLVRRLGTDKEGLNGLRQGAADYIKNRFLGNREAGLTGTAALKPDAFMSFLRTNQGALSQLFGSDEMRVLNNTAADMMRSARIKGVSKPAVDADLVGPAVITGTATTSGAVLGGLPGALASLLTAAGAQALKTRGIQNVNDLVAEALLNPRVARVMLRRTAQVTPKVKADFSNALIRAVSVTGAEDLAAAPGRPKTEIPVQAPREGFAPTEGRPSEADMFGDGTEAFDTEAPGDTKSAETPPLTLRLAPGLTEEDIYGPAELPPPEPPTAAAEGASNVPAETVAFVSSLSPDEAKALAIVGEASPNLAEMRGVAHVLENRARRPQRFGGDIYAILTEGEFDAFKTGPERLQTLMASDRYRRALRIVQDIGAGRDKDITGGATHFLAPALMKQKGYKYPSWAKNGRRLGQTLFFANVA